MVDICACLSDGLTYQPRLHGAKQVAECAADVQRALHSSQAERVVAKFIAGGAHDVIVVDDHTAMDLLEIRCIDPRH